MLLQNKKVHSGPSIDRADLSKAIRKELDKLLTQMGVGRKADEFEPILKMAKLGVAFALVRGGIHGHPL